MAVVNQGFPPNQLNPNQVPPGPPTQFDPNQIPPNQGVPIQLNSNQVPPGSIQLDPNQVPPGPTSLDPNQGSQKKTYFQLLKELQNKAIENMGKLTGPIRERAQALAQKAINTAKNVGTRAASTAMSVGKGVATRAAKTAEWTPAGFVAGQVIRRSGALNAAKAQANSLMTKAQAKSNELQQQIQKIQQAPPVAGGRRRTHRRKTRRRRLTKKM